MNTAIPKNLFLLAGLSMILSSCLNDDDFYERQQQVYEQNIQEIEAYIQSEGLDMKKAYPYGEGEDPVYYYKIYERGADTITQQRALVTMKYKGSLLNGEVFNKSDSTVINLAHRYTRPPGLVMGLPLIGVGGKIKLILPAYLGYGEERITINDTMATIPPNSVLIYDAEVLKIADTPPF